MLRAEPENRDEFRSLCFVESDRFAPLQIHPDIGNTVSRFRIEQARSAAKEFRNRFSLRHMDRFCWHGTPDAVRVPVSAYPPQRLEKPINTLSQAGQWAVSLERLQRRPEPAN